MKASSYNIVVRLREGRSLVYNSMSRATALWDPHESAVFEQAVRGDPISSDDARIVSVLLYGGFLLRDEVSEVDALRMDFERTRNSSSQIVLTVAPTLMCNFGCDYCFQGSDKPAGTMELSVQDATAAFVRGRLPAAKHLHVAWYGGEPLLAQNVIVALSERFMAMCASSSIGYDATMVTNGYGLTATVARTLVSKNIKQVQVTLDGPAREHDQRRHRLGGGPTFERIVTNMKSVIDETPLRVSVRVNVDLRNQDGVIGLLDDLNRRGFSQRPNFRMYFAPVEAITEGCHGVVESCMDKSEYARLEARVVRYAFDCGLTSLPYPPRFHGLCGAIRTNGFVIIPNGDIHKCWDTVSIPEQRVGSVLDPDALFADPRVQQWVQWTPFDQETCVRCKLLPSCAGSCAHKHINVDQTAGEAGTLPCPSWKYNLNERLILMAERSGAISEHDYDIESIRTNTADICADDRNAASFRSSKRVRLALITDTL